MEQPTERKSIFDGVIELDDDQVMDIRTKPTERMSDDHKYALEVIERLIDAGPETGTEDGKLLSSLASLVEFYEKAIYPMTEVSVDKGITKITDEYGQLHEEECELNSEDGSYDGCTCAMKELGKDLTNLLESKRREWVGKALDRIKKENVHKHDNADFPPWEREGDVYCPEVDEEIAKIRSELEPKEGEELTS
jgi:antitoxin component HigA of HigAB toxin-antitoxin module